MNAEELLNVQVQEKRMYALLNEVFDLTKQLSEAVDRRDEIAIRMLLSMREEPLGKLRRADLSLKELGGGLEAADADRLTAMLAGAEPERPEEAALCDQVGVNRRLLRQIIELDERTNRKLAHEKSVYQ